MDKKLRLRLSIHPKDPFSGTTVDRAIEIYPEYLRTMEPSYDFRDKLTYREDYRPFVTESQVRRAISEITESAIRGMSESGLLKPEDECLPLRFLRFRRPQVSTDSAPSTDTVVPKRGRLFGMLFGLGSEPQSSPPS
jgi:hypothetical protein